MREVKQCGSRVTSCCRARSPTAGALPRHSRLAPILPIWAHASFGEALRRVDRFLLERGSSSNLPRARPPQGTRTRRCPRGRAKRPSQQARLHHHAVRSRRAEGVVAKAEPTTADQGLTFGALLCARPRRHRRTSGAIAGTARYARRSPAPIHSDPGASLFRQGVELVANRPAARASQGPALRAERHRVVRGRVAVPAGFRGRQPCCNTRAPKTESRLNLRRSRMPDAHIKFEATETASHSYGQKGRGRTRMKLPTVCKISRRTAGNFLTSGGKAQCTLVGMSIGDRATTLRRISNPMQGNATKIIRLQRPRRRLVGLRTGFLNASPTPLAPKRKKLCCYII
jgi:hypothetical protein